MEVGGKLEKQWDGLTLDQVAALPHTFYFQGQKFVLKWLKADEDSGVEGFFMIEANGQMLAKLEYLSPSFKLIDEDPAFFDADLSINGKEAVLDSFEWRTGTLGHKILQATEDSLVEGIEMNQIKHSAQVTSETLSIFAKLNIPETGLNKLRLEFNKLDEKVSETVLD